MRLPFVSRTLLEQTERHHGVIISKLRDRVERERGRAERAEQALADASARHSAELAAAYDRLAQLAMNPPTGVMKGPTLIDPLEGFPEKTKAALRAVTKGRSRDIQDAIIKKARTLMASTPNIEDEALAERVRRGEYVG